MSAISSVVSVIISAASRSPTRQGFGVPAVMSYHTVFPERFRRYTSPASMLLDGFAAHSSAYRMAAALFRQSPSVPEVVVARSEVCPAFSSSLTIVSATQGARIRARIIDSAGAVQNLSYLIPAAATTSTVAIAVEAIIEAYTGIASSVAGAVITITPDAATGYRPSVTAIENCLVEDTTLDAGYDTQIANLFADDSSWYFFATDAVSAPNVLKLAAWASTYKRLYFAATSDSAELTSGGTLGATLKSQGNTYTVLVYSPDPSEEAAVSWVGACAPKSAGPLTWANKELRGVSPANLTDTQIGNLEGDNINHYTTIAGLGAVRTGAVSSGEWIDVVLKTDALLADIQESVWAMLANADAIPFDDQGLEVITSAIDGALRRSEAGGLLLPGESTVTMPSLASIPAADRRARLLKGVEFSGVYASAVHAVQLVGKLSY
jgi:hypothetical protein